MKERRKKTEYNFQPVFLVIYYSILLGFLLWLLFDIWSERNYIPRLLTIWRETIDDPLYKTMTYAFIGGAIGSILYGIRMLFHYYAKERNYNPRYFWKYIISPLEGASLSLVVISVIRGGIAMYGGNVTGGEGAVTTDAGNFAAFGVGALIGIGARNAIRWLIDIARAMFRTGGIVQETDQIDSTDIKPIKSITGPALSSKKALKLKEDKKEG